MRTARRFVNDESGMTMALAVIMMVVLGVMGAGLMTFVMRDLDTVVEENRGQQAFEMADAGIQAAKRQLISDCVGEQATTCSALYGGTGASPWSAAQGGLTLGDLDGDGPGGTADNVHVKISQPSTNHFLVVSTGTYGGVATRKIEAKFEAGAGGGGGGGGNITFPSAWTPSNILVKGPGVHLNGMSMFTKQNIIFDGVTNQTSCTTSGSGQNQKTDCTNPWTNFQNEYETTGGILDNVSGSKDDLEDWDSRFLTPSGYWNVVGRKKLDNQGDPVTGGNRNSTMFNDSGFAAEGYVCGTTTTTSHVPKCGVDADSIADGHYAYDKTTGSKLAWNWNTSTKSGSYSKPYGQRVRFEKKPDPVNDPNNQDLTTISYPFPTDPAPDPARLKGAALGSNTYYKALNSNTFYRPADPGTLLTWDQIVPNGNNNKVVFIDAQNHDLTYDINSSRNGIIVAWCGNLRMTNANFQGIVVGLKGNGATLGNDGPAPAGSGGPSTDCDLDDNKGVLTTDNSTLKAWLYSNNTSIANPGIQIGENTTLFFMPNGNFNLLDVLLQDPVVTSISSKGWRELYQ
jgi:hypothetical protein